MADNFEKLAWRNRFVKELSQEIEGADCFSPFAFLNPDSNLIVLDLTEAQFTRMFSALLTGADITYPEESHQIQVDFLKGLHCPPSFSEAECVEYPTYANFITYEPMNPYIDPSAIPDGYATQPFIVNGENGNDVPGFQHYDVIVPLAAITLDFNWFEDIAGALPTIKIMVNGAGTVQVRLLAIPQGGMAVITLDNPPNLLDIISGIVTGAENIVDLNQDLISLPPETAQEIIFPVTIDSTGLHTVYVVYLPIIDDALIPIRFGGGLRGVNLCDFVEAPEMGITALRFENCNLEAQNNGVWAVVPGWEDWLDCIPSSPGGGGSGALRTRTYQWKHATNTVVTNSNIYSQVFSIPHTFEYPNFLLIVEGLAVLAGTATHWLEVEFTLDGVSGLDTIPAAALANINREFGYSNRWANVETGVIKQIELQIRSRVNGQSVTFLNQNTIAITIIEFGNPEDLFVEDIRIVGRDLQKKIGGAWITVTDSLAAILNAIETTANNALAAASSAIAVNNTQQTQINSIITVNNNQNTRLTNLESFQEDAELELSQHTLTLANHESRIDALEAAVGGDSPYFVGGVWSLDLDWFDAGSQGIDGWTLIDGSLTTLGVASTIANPSIATVNSPGFENNQITHLGIKLVRLGHSNPMSIQAQINGLANPGRFTQSVAAAGVHVLWMRVPNLTSGGINLAVSSLSSDRFYINGLIILGRGTNPF